MRKRLRDCEPEETYELAWGTQCGAPVLDEPIDHVHLLNLPNPSVMYHTRVALGKGFGRVTSIADLSCGDGVITQQLASFSGIEPILGDLGRGYPIQGPLTDTITRIPLVDLYVCSETIEHLDDPDEALRLIRVHCRNLLLTTPIDEDKTAPNGEIAGGHLWTWSREDVEDMLHEAGFKVSAYIELDMTPFWYTHCRFGMWACR